MDIRSDKPAAGSNGEHVPARVGAIVVAAGLMSRQDSRPTHGEDMCWAPLAGRPVLAWTVASILHVALIDEVVLVVTPERISTARALEKQERWKRVTILPASGPRRCDAVSTALHTLSPACRWVVVHEAIRPLVTPELVAAGLTAAQETGAAAASVPVKETIKRVQEGVVAETLDRSTLALLQTPQVFERSVLLAAHQQSAPTMDLPDDATLALLAGARVATFPGIHDNIAITTSDDIAVVEALLAHGRKQLR